MKPLPSAKIDTLIFEGSVAGGISVKAQPVAGLMTLQLPNVLPLPNQALVVTSINSEYVVALGWAAAVAPILQTNGVTNVVQSTLNIVGSGAVTASSDTNGNLTISSPLLANDWVNLMDYGPAVLKSNKWPTIAAGTSTLTVSAIYGDVFSPSDVGSAIRLPNCGVNYTDLWTTIASYTSATQVTLATTATHGPLDGLTENDPHIVWGPNIGTAQTPAFQDSVPAITAAITAAAAARKGVYVPSGTYCYASTIDPAALDPGDKLCAFAGAGGTVTATIFVAQNPAVAPDNGFMAPTNLMIAEFSGFAVMGVCYPNPGTSRTAGAELGIWTEGNCSDIYIMNSSFLRGAHIRITQGTLRQAQLAPNAGSLYAELDGMTVMDCQAPAIILDCAQSDRYVYAGEGGTVIDCMAGVQERQQGFPAAFTYTGGIGGALNSAEVVIIHCNASGNVPPSIGYQVDSGTLIQCRAHSSVTTPLQLGAEAASLNFVYKYGEAGETAYSTFNTTLSIPSLTLGGTGPWTAIPYDVSLYVEGTTSNSEALLSIVPAVSSFPSGAAGSSATATVAATGSAVYTFSKNGTAFATATFAASGTVATWAQASTVTFNGTSDILTLVGPATADATLANIGFRLSGTRV